MASTTALGSFSKLRVLSSNSGDWSRNTTPFQSLEYKRDDDNKEGASYFICRDSGKEGRSLLKITRGDFKEQDYKNADLLAGLHIQSNGYVFLESLHPTQGVYFALDLSQHHIRAPKRLLPKSKPKNERMLVLLDWDAYIFINDEIIEFKIGSLECFSDKTESGNPVKIMGTSGVAMGLEDEDEDPQILVQQSHPQESLRRGDTDLAYLTPAVPETIQEEPRVHETPSVKSRFMNPNSATVTLPRALPREDTFGDLNEEDEPTPRGAQSTAKSFVASVSSNGLMFGGHNGGRPGAMGTSQLSAVDGADMSTSDEEEEVMQGSKFFKKAPVEAGSVESTADEEVPASTIVATLLINPTGDVALPEETNEVEENRGLEAEDMRRQFSEAPMVTSFTGLSEESTPATGGAEYGEYNGSEDLDTPIKSMKQGVPEGFLYEEHKKDITPKQTYGKNKRMPRPKPKDKKPEMDKIVEIVISEDELMQEGHDESAKAKNKNKRKVKEVRVIKDTDESQNEEQGEEEDDTTMETADDEEDEVAAPKRTQGRRGRWTMPSQLDSTAATEVESKSGKVSRQKTSFAKKPERFLDKQDEEKPDIEDKEAEPTSAAKSTRSRRGAKKLSDASEHVFSTAPEETPRVLPDTRKRRRTPENEDQELLDGEINSTPGTVGSTIQVAEGPKSKRARITPQKKPAVTKRGGKKDATPSPLENIEQALGDTQYTFTDVTQTQSMDHVEIKTPKTARKKAASSVKKASLAPSRKKKVDTQHDQTEEREWSDGADEGEGVQEGKTRTREQYEGDSPKIVFSNSGLDGKKDIEKFLRANGGKKMQNVSAPGVNFLVVGPGELKRTPKLTVGVALGKWVVEDQWLVDSKAVGYFLDPDQYIPHDPTHEKAWTFSLRTAISRGRKGENNILKDHNVYITSSLLSQLKASKQEESLVEMLKAASAGSIIKKAPKGRKEDGDKALILGAEKGDGDVGALEKLGWSVHGTGIVAISVLRGRLEMGEEFRISAEEGSQKMGRGRKGK